MNESVETLFGTKILKEESEASSCYGAMEAYRDATVGAYSCASDHDYLLCLS